jgi:hypothetical protein
MTVVTEYHIARVTSVADDEGSTGRFKVACVGILGDDVTEIGQFVEPRLPWGSFLIPDVGDLVEISCTSGAHSDESFQQSSIDNLELRWHGVRYYTADANFPVPINTNFTDTSYGKRRGIATPLGHVLFFDDTADAQQISIIWSKKLDSDPATEQSRLDFLKDGSIKFSVLDGHTFHYQKDKVVVSIAGGLTLTLEGKDADAKLKLGDGAVHVAIVEHLETLYGQLKSYIENALVNTAMGPSATILATMGPAPAWDPNINSTHVSIPDV